MTVHAKPCGFRTHLGNRCAIPTFPPPRRLLDSFNTNQERSFPPPSPQASFRLILQLEKTPIPAQRINAPQPHRCSALSSQLIRGIRVCRIRRLSALLSQNTVKTQPLGRGLPNCGSASTPVSYTHLT